MYKLLFAIAVLAGGAAAAQAGQSGGQRPSQAKKASGGPGATPWQMAGPVKVRLRHPSDIALLDALAMSVEAGDVAGRRQQPAGARRGE